MLALTRQESFKRAPGSFKRTPGALLKDPGGVDFRAKTPQNKPKTHRKNLIFTPPLLRRAHMGPSPPFVVVVWPPAGRRADVSAYPTGVL